MKGAVAPRFINKPAWDAYVAKQKKANKPIDPQEVYEPKPDTWNNWIKVTEEVEHKAELALTSRSTILRSGIICASQYAA